MKKGEKLFVVDLESVSIFSPKKIEEILSDEKTYLETPFLYLITSLSRNLTMNCVSQNLNYLEKKETGSWMIYAFQKQ